VKQGLGSDLKEKKPIDKMKNQVLDKPLVTREYGTDTFKSEVERTIRHLNKLKEKNSNLEFPETSVSKAKAAIVRTPTNDKSKGN